MTYNPETNPYDVISPNGCTHEGVVTRDKNKTETGFQFCPKCEGMGKIAGGAGSAATWQQCPVCRGAMIINKQTGQPPMVTISGQDLLNECKRIDEMKRKRHYNIHGRGGKADFEAQYKRPGRLRPVRQADTTTDNIFTVFAFLAGLFILKQILDILWQT